MIITVGVDPGLSCGLAILRDGRRLLVRQDTGDACMDDLEAVLWNYRNDAEVEIAVERFVITAQTGRRTQQTDALEITGTVERIARTFEVPVVRQTISDVKKMVKNPMLRRLGLYVRPSEVDCPDANDANDAMRQAIYRIAMSHASLFQAMLKGI